MLSDSTYGYFKGMSLANFIFLGGPVRWDTYYGYLIFRFVESLFEDVFQITKVFKGVFHLCGYGLGLKYHLNKTYRYYEIPVFMNAYLQYSEDFKKRYFLEENQAEEQDKETKRKPKRPPPFKNGSESMLRMYAIMAALISTTNVFETFAEPQSDRFLSSLLENPRGLTWDQKLPFSAFHVFLLSSFLAMNLYFTYPVYSYMFSRTMILREMIPDGKKKITRDTLRSRSTTLKVYRVLQVEHNIFMDCFREVYFPGHNLLQGSAATCCFYGMIKIDGPLVATFSVLAIVYIAHFTVFFGTLSLFYAYSTQLLSSIQSEDPYLKRVVRSFTPLRIYIGPYYFIRKMEVLSFWSMIADNTITLLISF